MIYHPFARLVRRCRRRRGYARDAPDVSSAQLAPASAARWQSLLLLFRLLLCAHHGLPGVASENWVNANGRIGSDQSVGRLVVVASSSSSS